MTQRSYCDHRLLWCHFTLNVLCRRNDVNYEVHWSNPTTKLVADSTGRQTGWLPSILFLRNFKNNFKIGGNVGSQISKAVWLLQALPNPRFLGVCLLTPPGTVSIQWPSTFNLPYSFARSTTITSYVFYQSGRCTHHCWSNHLKPTAWHLFNSTAEPEQHLTTHLFDWQLHFTDSALEVFCLTVLYKSTFAYLFT